MNNIIEWTKMKVVDLIKSARDRKAWKTIVGQSPIVPQQPAGKGTMMTTMNVRLKTKKI